MTRDSQRRSRIKYEQCLSAGDCKGRGGVRAFDSLFVDHRAGLSTGSLEIPLSNLHLQRPRGNLLNDLGEYRSGDFHVFPDSMSNKIGEAYQSFAENVVEADPTEG